METIAISLFCLSELKLKAILEILTTSSVDWKIASYRWLVTSIFQHDISYHAPI